MIKLFWLILSKTVLCIFQETGRAENSLPNSKAFSAVFCLNCTYTKSLFLIRWTCSRKCCPESHFLEGLWFSHLLSFQFPPPSLQVMTLLFESAKLWKMLNTLSAQLLLFPALILKWRNCISPACECCSHLLLALWGFFWVLISFLNAFLQGILSLEKKQGKQRLCSEGMYIKV